MAGTGDELTLPARSGSVGVIGVCSFPGCVWRDVLLEVLLVAVEVFCARQRILEEDEEGQEHL